MKALRFRSWRVWWLLLALYPSLGLAFPVPKGCHQISDLDEALAIASAKRQPIAFLITGKDFTPT